MSTLTIDTETLPTVSDPEILGGTTVFKGAGVPVKTLFDYLEDGFSLTAFLDNFPTVKKEDAIRLLEAASDTFLKASLSRRIPPGTLRAPSTRQKCFSAATHLQDVEMM